MNLSLLGFTRQPVRRLSIQLIHVPTSRPLAKRQPIPQPKPRPLSDVANVPADVAEFFRSLDLANVPAVQVVGLKEWEPVNRPL